MISLQFSLETPKNDPLNVQITFSLFDLKHSCEKARQESICKYLLTCLLRTISNKKLRILLHVLFQTWITLTKEHVHPVPTERLYQQCGTVCKQWCTNMRRFLIRNLISLYLKKSRNILQKQLSSISQFIITLHLYLIHIYLFKWDCDQHESFGFFGHCALIKKSVDHVYFSAFVNLLFCKPSCAVSTSLVRTNLNFFFSGPFLAFSISVFQPSLTLVDTEITPVIKKRIEIWLNVFYKVMNFVRTRSVIENLILRCMGARTHEKLALQNPRIKMSKKSRWPVTCLCILKWMLLLLKSCTTHGTT